MQSVSNGNYPFNSLIRNRKTGERYGVKDIPEGAGRHDEPEIECSMFCVLAEQEINQRS
jgi:hypothetical protein